MLNSSTVATLPELNWMKEKFGPNLDTFDAGYLKSGYLKPPHTALGEERAHSDHFAATHIASTILKQGFVWKVKLFIQSKKKANSINIEIFFQFNYKFAQFTLSSLKICSKCLMRNPWLDGRTSAQAEQTPLIHTAASYIFNANRIEAFHSPCSIMMVGVVGFLGICLQ